MPRKNEPRAVTVHIEATFSPATGNKNAKHIEALMKLLEKRASSFKLWSERIPYAQEK